jgi:hypothetical protein
LAQVAACTTNAHPSLDFVEAAEGNRRGGEFTVGSVEGIIRCVLMVCIVLVSTLGWARSSDKIAKITNPLSRKFLPLYADWVALLHQIGVAVVLSLCIADG